MLTPTHQAMEMARSLYTSATMIHHICDHWSIGPDSPLKALAQAAPGESIATDCPWEGAPEPYQHPLEAQTWVHPEEE